MEEMHHCTLPQSLPALLQFINIIFEVKNSSSPAQALQGIFWDALSTLFVDNLISWSINQFFYIY